MNFPLFTERFAIGLFETGLSGSLLAGLVWLVGKAFPRLPHGVRGALWWLVCARFVVGVLGTVLDPTPPFAVSVPSFWTARAAPNAAAAFPSDATPLLAQTPKGTAPLPPARAAANEAPEAGTFAASLTAAAWLTLPQITLAVWLVGLGFRAGVSIVYYARLQKQMKAARFLNETDADAPDAARAFWEAATEAARLMNRRKLPRLLLSPAPCDPLVTGWRKPTVLLSQSDALRLSKDELCLVLCHEMAHLRRRDLFWGIAPHLALHLFWFWPPACFACREWSLACEAACDYEAARAAQTPPRVYGELLLKLGVAPGSPPAARFLPAVALPVSAHFHLLQRRLLMLSQSSPVPVPRRRRIVSAFGGAALLAATLPLALLPVRFAAAGDSPAYTKINGDTDKSWSVYPDAPRNLNFSSGLANWQLGKNNQKNGYAIAVENVKAPTAGPSAVLQAARPTEGEDGIFVQYARPAAYRGKRVRFSGWVKTENAQSAGFWLRMDTPTWQKAWNKIAAPLFGNTEWTNLSYVFDVPGDAQGWAFGTDLSGAGKVWLHAPQFEIVDKTVPVSLPAYDSSPDAKKTQTDRTFALDFDDPANLDFKSGLIGWWNDNPQHNAQKGYAVGLDAGAGRLPGQNAAYLKSINANPESYGTLAQNTQAKALRGKRIRMTTYLKTENAQAAGYWIVVHTGDQSNGFNRTNDPIKGTTGWTKYETVLDIPREAEGISFGLDLTGTGKVWTNGFLFDVIGDVPKNEAVDAKPDKSGRNKYSGVDWSNAPSHPFNLDFEQKLTGWQKLAPRSSTAPDYEAGIDPAQPIRPGGKAAPAFLRAMTPSPKGYGTLMQGVQAGEFKNHRVRFSGFIKTNGVKDARLFLRLDTKHGVSAWNMGKSPVAGTNGWLCVEYVFDVPADADGVAYGVSLDGPGTVWADGFRFETVSPDVPVTPEPGG